MKVLHGSDSDIVWLQRDFGIYVANLFDTGQAARVLSFPSAGLAYLLSHFCSVKVRASLINRLIPTCASLPSFARCVPCELCLSWHSRIMHKTFVVFGNKQTKAALVRTHGILCMLRSVPIRFCVPDRIQKACCIMLGFSKGCDEINCRRTRDGSLQTGV